MSTEGEIKPGTIADDFNGHCLHLIAISLKRIADQLERIGSEADFQRAVAAGVTSTRPTIGEQITAALTAPINQYGESIGEAIQGQLERGRQ